MRTYAVLALFAAVAFGQTPAEQNVDRTFYFTQAKTAQEFQEAATTIRIITNIQQASTDDVQKSLTLQGTADQIVLAQWLYNELDQAGASSSREYFIPGKPDDVTRVSYLTQPQTSRDFVEATTVVRSITNIRQVAISYEHRAMVMRGSAGQIAMAAWLVAELEKHATASAAPEYHASDDPEGANVVRVFYLKSSATNPDFVEAVTLVRSIANVSQTFTYSAPRAVVMRGTAGQMALAAWLFSQIDKPVKEQRVASEYVVPESKDDVVRVLYLAGSGTPQELAEVATKIRTESNVPQLSVYSAPKAIAVRGTSQQVALAEQLSREQ